jgi:hypothetical protein
MSCDIDPSAPPPPLTTTTGDAVEKRFRTASDTAFCVRNQALHDIPLEKRLQRLVFVLTWDD